MPLTDMLRRVFLGGGMPTTESVQREIEGVLSATGKADAATLYERVAQHLPTAQRRMAVDQACQILVNRGLVTARKKAATVDPIYASGAYMISYVTDDPT
jgi:hypothetical protein